MQSTPANLSETLLLKDPQRKSAEGSATSFAHAAALLIAFILAFTAVISLIILACIPDLAAIAILSYTFGCRHGIDADHIAAIDNVRSMACMALSSFGSVCAMAQPDLPSLPAAMAPAPLHRVWVRSAHSTIFLHPACR